MSTMQERTSRRVSRLSRRTRNKVLKQFAELIEKYVVKVVRRKEFQEHVLEVNHWNVEGHNDDAKKKIFNQWFKANVKHRNYVYVFCSKRGCEYVGRTMGHGSRPTHHFDKKMFSPVRRVSIYGAKDAKAIPKLECLAFHCFKPVKNKVTPSADNCPICKIRQLVKAELKCI